jgi:endonuclease/exonuclease/phosphatase family metal-dependent hydrolase
MSWNMAGAKMLENLDPPPGPAAGGYITAFRDVWDGGIGPWLATPQGNGPDIILLQECIGFEDLSPAPSGRWQSGKMILGEIFPGYECFFFPSVTSHKNPHPGKWKRYESGGEVDACIPAYVDAQQGYGICIREGQGSRKLWIPYRDPHNVSPDADLPGTDCYSCFESIGFTSGLYLGSRDTEPRAVLMGRTRLESEGETRYLNYLNVHLNTLTGEREGSIRLNRMASASRLRQIDLILDNVVSAYQEARQYKMPVTVTGGREDIWIIGGDFNATYAAEEIEHIRHMGFVDAVPDKRIYDADPDSPYHNQAGTKWSIRSTDIPAVVLDHIFCGLEYSTFPAGGIDVSGSRRPYRPHFDKLAFASDHAVLYAEIRLQS